MGKFIDFKVPYNDDLAELGRTIIRHIIVNRLQFNKPTILFLAGDSGEGKSYTGLKILEIVNEYYGVETDLDLQVVYTPLEYTRKVDAILFNKEYKKYRIIMIDESREVLKAKLWYSFINQAISDINAMMRGVKPIAVIFISQFIKDIDADVRRTITYYGTCMRPLGNRTRLKLWRLWKDDYDIENPKLRKRPLQGFVIMPNGRHVLYRPAYFEVSLPSKKVIEEYERLQRERKTAIIRRKLELMLQQLQKELGEAIERVDMLVDYYATHPEALHLVLEKGRKKLKVRKDIGRVLNLTKSEVKEFERKLLERLAEKGIISMMRGEEVSKNG